MLLADGLGEDDLPCRNPAQPALLLLVGPPVEQPALSLDRDLRGHHPVSPDLLVDDDVLAHAGTQPTPLCGDHRAAVAAAAELLVDLAREAVLPVRRLELGAAVLGQRADVGGRSVDPGGPLGVGA